MKESTRAILVLAIVAIGAVVSYEFFLKPFLQEQPKVQRVITANSTWSVTLQEYWMHGLISEETYRISNDNGKTTIFYAATNRAGTVTKEFSVPLTGPSGTFLFEELRAEGVWELDDRAVRPNPKVECIVEVEQTLGDEGGSRAFSFSDPQYWATTHAQEFQLRLPPKGAAGSAGASAGSTPVGVAAAGRSLQDVRYWKIVTAIRNFGPPSVLAAEQKVRAQLIETATHPIPPK